jgi:hypothetical protein
MRKCLLLPRHEWKTIVAYLSEAQMLCALGDARISYRWKGGPHSLFRSTKGICRTSV